MLQSSVVPAMTGMGINSERAVYLPVGFSTYIYVYNIVLCCGLQLTLQIMCPTDRRPTASTPLPSLYLRISVSEG